MITLWHNPRCSKSRQALALLEQAGAAVELRLYLKQGPDLAEVTALCKALDRAPIEMMRRGEAAFKAAGFSADTPEDALLQAMVAHPILIERPIAVSAERAVIGRPPETVLTLL